MRLPFAPAAALLAALLPSATMAQSGWPFGGPRDVYGTPLRMRDRGYPPGYPPEGYQDSWPGAGPEYGGAAVPLPGGYGGYETGVQGGLGLAVAPQYRRQIVAYRGREKPGTIIIDTPSRHLYLVQAGGRAIRYGIGVGRPGFTWAGRRRVSLKRMWPDWRPPSAMLKRRPDLPRHMAGGPDNPLGARALYLGSSLYRVHGTNEPATIGHAVSSGCIRMLNRDVIDLYGRVPVGAPVVVI